MRQIHPRSSYSPALPTPVPRAVPPAAAPIGVTVDLRDVRNSRHPSLTDEQRLRRQLSDVRRAMEALMQELARLVDRREDIKGRLRALGAEPGPVPVPDDPSVVAWGFLDDDL